MEWVATVVAVVAALVAGWQAWEARRARMDARASATAAQDYEERAVAAVESLAASAAEQREAERAERERYRDPWTITRSVSDGRHTYRFELGGDEEVCDVRLEVDGPRSGREKVRVGKFYRQTMQPGDVNSVEWHRGMQSAAQIGTTLRWTRPNGEQRERRVTLD